GRHRYAVGDRLYERLLLYGHRAVRGGRDVLQLAVHPVRRRADAAHRVVLTGGGVPGTERDEPLYGRLHAPGIDMLEHVTQARVGVRPGERAGGRGPRVGEQGDARRRDGRGGQECTPGTPDTPSGEIVSHVSNQRLRYCDVNSGAPVPAPSVSPLSSMRA